MERVSGRPTDKGRNRRVNTGLKRESESERLLHVDERLFIRKYDEKQCRRDADDRIMKGRMEERDTRDGREKKRTTYKRIFRSYKWRGMQEVER